MFLINGGVTSKSLSLSFIKSSFLHSYIITYIQNEYDTRDIHSKNLVHVT